MIWQESNMLIEEIEHNNDNAHYMTLDEIEHHRTTQIHKFQDPAKDENRQAIISIMTKFSQLLVNGEIQQISQELMTEDCEVFLFDSRGRTSIRYSTPQNKFPELCKGERVLERWVRQTNVDVERSTGFQLCYCRIYYEEYCDFVDEASFETFSIKDNKISKYRKSSALVTPAHDYDPLKPSKKERVLAKAKQMCYAFCDKPDLEKVASMMDENTEFKGWSWDEHQHFSLSKENFAANYKNLEDTFEIKSVVPYQPYGDRGENVGACGFVYCLEGKKKCPGEQFVWPNVCVLFYNDDLSLKKVTQTGELQPLDKATFPFECFSREKMIEKVNELFSQMNTHLDMVYNSMIDFHCDLCSFCPPELPFASKFQGLNQIDMTTEGLKRNGFTVLSIKPVDIFIDHHDPQYDVALVHAYCQVKIKNTEVVDSEEKVIDLLIVYKLGFENGKLVKVINFHDIMYEPIPCPFDDKNAINDIFLK